MPSITPVHQLPKLPITAGVCALAVVASTLAWTIGPDALLFDARALEGEPWRWFTAPLVHAHLLHLVACVVLLWTLGSVIELQLSHGRTALFYGVSAIATCAAEAALGGGTAGLSGVVYAAFTFVWIVGEQAPRFIGVLDRPTITVLLGWCFVAVAIEQAGLVSVASVAQVCGGVIGGLAAAAFTSRTTLRVISLVGIGAIVLASVLASGPMRAWLRANVGTLRPSASHPE